MDQVKEAFQKVKQDISSLRKDLDLLKLELSELNNYLFDLRDLLISIKQAKIEEKPKEENTTEKPIITTGQHIITTDPRYTPTHNGAYSSLKDQIQSNSTGNKGVPTDRQTDQQTDRHINSLSLESENPIDNAARILDSLDSLKKEIRLKFKRLTEREMALFSAIYQLDEQDGYVDYRLLAGRLNLTESSIRDYVGRLINKGIPIEKNKINNKTIHLSISDSLKKVASLSTIIQLINV